MASEEQRVSFQNPELNFFVRDVARAARFYTDLLGFTETFRTPKEGVPIRVEMRLGQFILAVTSFDAASADHGLVLNPGQGAELAVSTDDTDAAYRFLTEHGAVSLSAPHDFRVFRVAWVADPEGNPIHIVGPARSRETEGNPA